MKSISLCMIVKNEEKVIGRCLESVKDIFDEIIIVDTGSADNTKEIVKQYTENIYDFEWVDDFSKARNYSFSKATKDYIMWLDADDIILENDRIQLKELIKSLSDNIDVVMMKYNVSFDEDKNPNLSYYRERIVKRENNFKWIDPIHEVLSIDGNIIHSDIAVTHMKEYQNDPKRNIRIFEKMIENKITLNARQQFYYARELYYNKKYMKAISEFKDFLNNPDGWIENKINACVDLSKCYKSINKESQQLESLLKSFTFDTPRAEVCCEIGEYYIDKEEYTKAIFWYELARSIPIDTTKGGFYLIDCYGYIPNIQLCVCYDKLGNYEKANYYNEESGKIKPNNQAYLYNKKYFDKILENKLEV